MPEYQILYTTAHPSGDGSRVDHETLVSAANPDAAIASTKSLLFGQSIFGCLDPRIKRVRLFKEPE